MHLKKKTMIRILTLICSLCFVTNINAQVTISTNDFEILDNTTWKGTLTYIDYQSGKPTDVATTMQIRVSDKIIEQDVQYVWEPDKNVKSKTKVKKDGRFLGNQEVISKIIKEDGSLQIVTTSKGKDDGKKASLFYTYIFNSENYKVTKEVQFADSDERFIRNSYTYTRLN